MSDPFSLQRFVDAQEGVFAAVHAELAAGRKQSHWMWFVFPQLKGLGSSATARHYAIGSLEEARAYLAHAVLGPRLRECTGLVNRIEGRRVEDLGGVRIVIVAQDGARAFELESGGRHLLLHRLRVDAMERRGVAQARALLRGVIENQVDAARLERL